MWIKTPLHSSFVYFGCPIKIFLKKVFYDLKIKVRKFPKRPRSRLLIFKQSSLVWNIGSHKLKGVFDCSFPTIWRDNICANTLRIKKVYVNWSQHKSFNPVWSFLKASGYFTARYGDFFGDFSIIWCPKQLRYSRSSAGTLEASHDSSCLNKCTTVTTFPHLLGWHYDRPHRPRTRPLWKHTR